MHSHSFSTESCRSALRLPTRQSGSLSRCRGRAERLIPLVGSPEQGGLLLSSGEGDSELRVVSRFARVGGTRHVPEPSSDLGLSEGLGIDAAHSAGIGSSRHELYGAHAITTDRGEQRKRIE